MEKIAYETLKDMDIVRDHFEKISEDIKADYPGHASNLLILSERTRRFPKGPRAANHSAVFEEVAADIADDILANPHDGKRTIGDRHNVNQGRVSDTIDWLLRRADGLLPADKLPKISRQVAQKFRHLLVAMKDRP